MKTWLIVLFSVSFTVAGLAQKPVETTNQFIISGLVDEPKTITFSDLEKEKIVTIAEFKITNHAGEFRKTYKNIKAVRLLDVWKDVTITATNPKFLSEYYVIFKATDGYSVVASWNELFNTEVGNDFYLVVEADGKSQAESAERILLISTKDFKTGRRHVKSLQSIEVRKI